MGVGTASASCKGRDRTHSSFMSCPMYPVEVRWRKNKYKVKVYSHAQNSSGKLSVRICVKNSDPLNGQIREIRAFNISTIQTQFA